MIPFGILATVSVLAALAVVVSRNPVISALWLALTLTAVAGVFVLLGAEFLAAVQIIVYAGAILVFFLFVIMLLNVGRLPTGEPRLVQRWLGLYLVLTVAVIVAFAIHATGDRPGVAVANSAPIGVGNTEALGIVLYRDYIFPFEVVSLLLTAAVVGAVSLAQKRPGASGGEGAS